MEESHSSQEPTSASQERDSAQGADAPVEPALPDPASSRSSSDDSEVGSGESGSISQERIGVIRDWAAFSLSVVATLIALFTFVDVRSASKETRQVNITLVQDSLGTRVG